MKFLGIIISGAGMAFWIAIEEYWEYFKELLNEIHPYLAPVVLGILILIGGIAIFYEYKNSKSKKTKSQIKEELRIKSSYCNHHKNNLEKRLKKYNTGIKIWDELDWVNNGYMDW